MFKQNYLTKEDLAETYKTGEFPAHVRTAGERVVVIMTQDWCPQWHDMESWLDRFDDKVTLYVLVYNIRPDFETILDFKENTWGNREIPYLRYYHKGQLVKETNWLPRTTFEAMIKMDAKQA